MTKIINKIIIRIIIIKNNTFKRIIKATRILIEAFKSRTFLISF